ncbi:MAG: hypothetical protein HY365_01660, partial [Candidatus Aenigmarchaeota archaeon]|nr:hypothetical protein [Candidatus Aenigmarchaeota archaeon]
TQPWTFFADNWLFLFSLLPFAAVLGIIRAKHEGRNLAVIWLIVAFVCISLLVHKEDRFYLPLLPPLALLAGAGLSSVKRFPAFVVVALLAVSSLVQISGSYASYNDEKNACFLAMMSFVKETVPETGIIYTDDSPVVFAYTKRETRFVPSGLGAANGSYVIWYSGDSTRPLLDGMEKKFTKVYSCPEDGSIYRMFRNS